MVATPQVESRYDSPLDEDGQAAVQSKMSLPSEGLAKHVASGGVKRKVGVPCVLCPQDIVLSDNPSGYIPDFFIYSVLHFFSFWLFRPSHEGRIVI